MSKLLLTPEELTYLFEERVAIGIHEGFLSESEAIQQARRVMIALLKEQGVKMHEAVYRVYRLGCEL